MKKLRKFQYWAKKLSYKIKNVYSYFPSAAKLWNKVFLYIRDKRTLAAFRSFLVHIHLL